MKFIRLIEVKSEIGAGTRGASLGVDALKIVCFKHQNHFFTLHPTHVVRVFNESLLGSTPFARAKHINKILEIQTEICDIVAETLLAQQFPLVLSGDHSTAAGTIAGIKKAFPYKKLGVIWIDAHADLHSPYTSPSGNMHGMPVAMALAEDNLDHRIHEIDTQTTAYWEKIKKLGVAEPKLAPQELVYIALRDTEEQEDAFMEAHQIKNYSVREVRQKGVETVVREILEQKLADCELIYISFDVDSLDAEISKGTGTPVADGLSVSEAQTLNRLLCADERVCSWEMVEINPLLDDKGNSMAEISFEILKTTSLSIQNPHSQLMSI